MLACLRALLPLRLQALYYLTRFFPAAVMTEAVAIFMSFAGGLNAVITPSTCCLILNLLEGAAGVDGWRWIFGLQGLPTIACGICVLRWLPDAPEDAAWLSSDDRALLLAHLSAKGGAASDTANGGEGGRGGGNGNGGDGGDGNGNGNRDGSGGDGGGGCESGGGGGMDGSSFTLSLCCRASEQWLRSVGAVARRPRTWVLLSMWFLVVSCGFAVNFFIAQLLQELFPAWSTCQIFLVAGVLFLVGVPLARFLSRWVDRGGRARCFRVAIYLPLAQFLGLAFSGGLLLASSAQPDDVALEAGARLGTFAVLALIVVSSASTSGPLWALHHACQPAHLHALSIPFVNALGMVGGFVGPFILGFFHEHFGPPCPSAGVTSVGAASGTAEPTKCIGAFAWGFLAVGLVGALGLALLGCAGLALGMDGRRWHAPLRFARRETTGTRRAHSDATEL